jgi:hypothetical protein
MGKANLTYYLFEGVLAGTVAGKPLHMLALSGGGGATTRKSGPSAPALVNNPYMTAQRQVTGVRGGPIPLGKYTIKKPEPWHGGKAAHLVPEDPKNFLERTGRSGGFLIHARGPLGSDGCIVPLNHVQFLGLIEGLTKDDGGTLMVLESQNEGRFA